MTRDEFKKLFLTEKAIEEVKDMREGNKVVVYHKLNSVYNKAIEAYRPSLDHVDPTYAFEFRSKVREIGHRDYEEAGNMSEKELLEELKKDKLLNFLIERKYPFEVEIRVLPSSVNVYGEPHHFNVYAKVIIDIEYLYCYYGQGYKRKIFLFTEDGVLTLRYPPYNLKDSVKNVGVVAYDNMLEITN